MLMTKRQAGELNMSGDAALGTGAPGSGIANDPPGGPFRMNGPDGLAYLKTVLEMAEKTDRFLFEITRNNYLAFGALAAVGAGTGVFSRVDPTMTVTIICVAVIVIACGSASLAFFYFRYSSSLFAKAWMIEKAWLRGQRSDNLLAKYQPGKIIEGATFTPDPDVEKLRAGKNFALSYERHRRWPFTFYPLANLCPAIGGAYLIYMIQHNLLVFRPI
jgi:hypothetical protein